MKTNQIMLRRIGGYDVPQRTKDSFLNGTILLKQWNKKMSMAKEMKDYFKLKSTMELNNKLSEMKVQFKTNNTWVLYSKYSNLGYVS